MNEKAANMIYNSNCGCDQAAVIFSDALAVGNYELIKQGIYI